MKRCTSFLLVFLLILTGCQSGNVQVRRSDADHKQDEYVDLNNDKESPDNSETTVSGETKVVENPIIDETTEAAVETSDVTNTENDASMVSSDEDIETQATNEADVSLSTSPLNEDYLPEFEDLSDPDMLQFVLDQYLAGMTEEFDSEDYHIDSINAIYLSQDYIDELEYNSLENIYFGYKLSELDEAFGDIQYSFTLGENNETVVEELQSYDYAFEKMMKDVAIGTGVIVVFVVITVATEGSDIPVLAAVSAISGAAAKGGLIGALSSGAVGASLGGAVEYFKSGNKEAALKAAALKGSSNFKSGAIVGAVTAGSLEGLKILKSASTIPTWIQSEETVLEVYGGETGRAQVSYLAGEEVTKTTAGATRPDVIKELENGVIEAIEVKNYDLSSSNNVYQMCNCLEREVSSRVVNLPEGSVQRIVLDVRGRGFSEEVIQSAVEKIHVALDGVYPDIPIDILRFVP